MLSTYLQEKENVKNNIKEIIDSLVKSHTILNKALKDCDEKEFQEAKDFIKNMNQKINEIDNYIIKILALYSPEARELRRFVAYLKITNELLRTTSNTKSFINGFLDVCELMEREFFEKYLYPLQTATLESLVLIKDMIDIDEADELQDKFNKIVVEENKTDDLFDSIEENVLQLELDYKQINKILKTFRKLEKISDRTKEIANLLLYYKIGGVLENV